LDIYAKNISGSTISGYLGASLLSITIGLPASLNPQPTIVSSSTIGGLSFTAPSLDTATINGTLYDIYTYFGNGTTSAAVNFPSNTEVLLGTFAMTGASVTLSNALLVMIPNGGASGQDYNYIAPNGTDQTDYANPFYSDIPSDPGLHNGNGVNNSSGNSLSYLGITSVIVPVKFTGFSATKNNDDALLNWAVVNENTAGDYYQVERSIDGSSFTTIASVPVKGNSTSNTYTYTDDNISSLDVTTIYYRIEQVDQSGNPAYTEVKAVSLTSGVTVSAYPNPTKDNVLVTVNLPEASNVSINVTDALGKQLQLIQLAGVKGSNISSINLSAYAPGNYLVKVISASGTTTLPIVKE